MRKKQPVPIPQKVSSQDQESKNGDTFKNPKKTLLEALTFVLSFLALIVSIWAANASLRLEIELDNEGSYRVQANPELDVGGDRAVISGVAANDEVRTVEGVQLDVSTVVGGIYQVQVIPFRADRRGVAVEHISQLNIEPKNQKEIGAGGILYQLPLDSMRLNGKFTDNGATVANYDCFALRVEDSTGHATLYGLAVIVPVDATTWDESFVTVMDDAYLTSVALPLPDDLKPSPEDEAKRELGQAYRELRKALLSEELVS